MMKATKLKIGIFFLLIMGLQSLIAQEQLVEFNLNIKNGEGDAIPRASLLLIQEEDTLAQGYANEEGVFQFETYVEVTGIPGKSFTEKNEELRVVPNPVRGNQVYIDLPAAFRNTDLSSLELYDASGKQFLLQEYLPGAYYFLRIRNTSYSTGFIIQESGYYDFKFLGEGNAASSLRKGLQAGHPIYVAAAKDEFLPFSDSIYVTADQLSYDLELQYAEKPKPAFSISGILFSGETVYFDASESLAAYDDSLIYSWSFGDGISGGGESAVHMFTEAGSYRVSLTARGKYNATDTLSHMLTIGASSQVSDTALINAFVSDENGLPLENVELKVGFMEEVFLTDASGKAELDVPVGRMLTIECMKEGYTSQVQQLDLQAGSEFGDHYFTLKSRSQAISVMDAEFGFQVKSAEGVSVEIPMEGLVTKDGAIVTGEVDVFLTPVNVADREEIRAFPGEFSGISPTMNAPLLLTYGVSEYHFEQDGEELHLAQGKNAMIEIPVFVTTHDDGSAVLEGDVSPLWSLDENSGIWVHEGEGTVVVNEQSSSGLALRAEVSHFSWWNHDIAPDPYRPIPECRIKDENGLPTLEIPSGGACFIEGEIQGPFGPRSRPSTMGDGKPLPVPPNRDMYLFASGGNGLYSGKTKINGPPGKTETIIIPLSLVYSGGDGDLIEADTVFLASIEDENDEDSYTFLAEAGESYIIGVGSGYGSNLQGSLNLYDEEGRLEANGGFTDKGYSYTFAPGQTMTYTISVQGSANYPGSYSLSLEKIGIIELNRDSTIMAQYYGHVKKVAFFAEKDDLISPAVLGEASAYSTRIYDPNGDLLSSSDRALLQRPGIFKASGTGYYFMEMTSTNQNPMSYIIGVSKIDEIHAFADTGEIAVYADSVEVLAKPFFAKFNGKKGQVINYAVFTQDSLSCYYGLYHGGEDFYTRRPFRNDDVVNFNGTASSNPYVDSYRLPEDGVYVLGIDPGRVIELSDLKGKFELHLFRPETREIQFRERISDSIVNPYNFKSYKILLDDTVSMSLFHDNMVRGGYLYSNIYDKNGNFVKNMRSNVFTGDYSYAELNEIYLDSVVYIDMNPSAAASGAYHFELVDHEEPQIIDPHMVPWTETRGYLTTRGEMEYYQFSANAGEFLHVQYHRDDTSSLEGNMSVYRIETGAANGFVNGTRISDPWYSSASTNFSADIAEITSVLENGGTYIIRIDGMASYHNDPRSVGAFTLKVGVMAASDQVIVDSKMPGHESAATGFVKLALRAVNEGGEVQIQSGDYHEIGTMQLRNSQVEISGVDTASTKVHFEGQTAFDLYSDSVYFHDFSLLSGGNGFYLRSRSAYHQFEQLSFLGGRFIDSYSYSDSIKILNCTVQAGGSIAINLAGSYNLIQGNSINEYGGSVNTALSLRGDHLKVMDNSIGSTDIRSVVFTNTNITGDSCLVEANRFNTYAFGLNINGAQNDPLNYVVVRNNSFGNLTGSNGGNSDGIYLAYIDNVQVYNNEFVDYPGILRGIRVRESGGSIYNNRIKIYSGDGIYVTLSESRPELQIVNNSIVKAEVNTYYDGIKILNNNGTSTPIRILNNIISMPESSSESLYGISAVQTILESDYNLFSGYAKIYTDNQVQGANDIEGDPLFADEDLHILSGSPARNAGTSNLAPSTDFEGNPRPTGAAVDIGADEYIE